MRTSVEIITPETAAKWLAPDINRDNRYIRKTHVDYLAKEIEAGNWHVSHQGIAFSASGRLLDGQHRLSAIALSGKAVRMLVVRDLPEDAFGVIDGGVKRTMSDRTTLVPGEELNRRVVKLCTAFIRSCLHHHKTVSPSQVEEVFLMRDGDASGSWTWAASEMLNVSNRLAPIELQTSLAVYHMVSTAKAEGFLRQYKTGASLSAGSPILALRRLAIEDNKRCDYWHAQAAMIKHRDATDYVVSGGRGALLYETAIDMLGNRNSEALIESRRQRGVKAADKRYAAQRG